MLFDDFALRNRLIVRSGTKVGREVFELSRGRLKVVGRCVEIDNVDLSAVMEFGCLVVNAPTANTIAAAEHGIALLAGMARNVAQADASVKTDASESTAVVPAKLLGYAQQVVNPGNVFTEFSSQYLLDNACPNKKDGQDRRCCNLELPSSILIAEAVQPLTDAAKQFLTFHYKDITK